MELSQIPAALQSRLRLSVIAALLSGPKKFRTLQDLTGATAGNLGKQLEQLEEEGYLDSKKEFVGRRPNTHLSSAPLWAGAIYPVCGPAGISFGPGRGGEARGVKAAGAKFRSGSFFGLRSNRQLGEVHGASGPGEIVGEVLGADPDRGPAARGLYFGPAACAGGHGYQAGV